MGRNYNEKNNANQKEVKSSPISDFSEREKARPIPAPRRKKVGEASLISNQSDSETRNLLINECIYKIDPIYNLYAASKDGKIIHIIKQVPNAANKNHNGYMAFTVGKYGDKLKIVKHIAFISLFGNALTVLHVMVQLLTISISTWKIVVYTICRL